jgi:saccharopine dehydrogenase-like NADP-dependent oxidoreductase
LVERLLPKSSQGKTLVERLAEFCGEEIHSETMKKIVWTGILNDEMIPLHNATPAQVLQDLLEKKWKLKKGDKDMIVMQHQFKFRISPRVLGVGFRILKSSLVVKGDDAIDTAMAKTVGLPLGIAAKLILDDKIKNRGVIIPVYREIYEPVLEELQKYNIVFQETNQ